MQFHLKSNDFVRNRDRQNPSGVMALCNPTLLSYIESLGMFHFFSSKFTIPTMWQVFLVNLKIFKPLKIFGPPNQGDFIHILGWSK